MTKLLFFLIATSAAAANNWSDPETWGGAVPANGAAVVIPHGQSILCDVSDINVASIELHGRLEVARQDTNITAGYIMLHGGELVAGSLAEPFAQKLTITLTGTDRAAMTGMGGRGIGAMGGGRIELIGAVPELNWTMLAPGYTASIGDTIITTESQTGWKVGDEIVIASTSFNYAEAEKRTITGITGNTVVLNEPLRFIHNGVIAHFPHGVAGVPTTIDERAEVGLLSHNIKIQGAADSESDGYGGHIMVMDDTSVALLQGVELFRMGQQGLLGRYPMHWHNVNDGGSASFMRFCSTHHTFNRGTTIHKTNNLTISDNVIYDTKGHGFFFEDGKETGNILTHNLVALVHQSPMDAHWDPASSISRNLAAPGAYWITNPNNNFIGNAAAGTAPGGFGFWFDIYHTPRPGSISADPSYNPSAQPFGVFRGNRAHSTMLSRNDGFNEGGWGLWFDRAIAPVLVEDFTSFKNETGQVWGAGGNDLTVTGSRLSGDRAVFNGHLLKDSLAVGGAIAFDGYDDVGRGQHSVFVNFGAIYQLRFPASESIADSTFINTPMVGNPFGFAETDAAIRFFRVENPEDSFGNGASGMFTYSEILTSAGAKNAASGAKGIAATDSLAWWTPGSMADFLHFGFNGEVAPYRVFIQPAGKTKVFATVANQGAQHTFAKMDEVHALTFTGVVTNETLILNAWEGAQEGRYLLLTLPAPSSNPVYTSEIYDRVQPVLQATSLADFNAATGITVFEDAAILHVKLPTHLGVLTMAGYTISDAPPPPPTNNDAVDVYRFTLAATAAAKNRQRTINATVEIRNRLNAPQPGVVVTFAWSGLVSGTAMATTNSNGIATFATKTKTAGSITGTVTALSGDYDSAIFNEPITRSITVQ